MSVSEDLMFVNGTINSIHRDLIKYKKNIKSILTEKDYKLAAFEIAEMNIEIDNMLESLVYCDVNIQKSINDIKTIEKTTLTQ